MDKKRTCKFSNEIGLEFPFLKKSKLDDGDVYCSTCNREFGIASGRYDIKRHVASEKHKKCVANSVSNKNLTTFFKPAHMGTHESNIAIAEAVFSFHTINHNHSFRSMDCSSKLIQNFFEPKFSCARTKTETIIQHVLMPYVLKNLKKKLDDASYLSVYTDASNHKDLKMFPIVIRLFNETEGIIVRLLEFAALPGETSDIIVEYVLTTLEKNNINKKLVAFCADNANTNFGGITRRGTNNVISKLNMTLSQNVMGIGCAAHIINNAIRTAADLLPIDVDAIVKKVYM